MLGTDWALLCIHKHHTPQQQRYSHRRPKRIGAMEQERYRQTDRQEDRQIDRQKDSQTDRKPGRRSQGREKGRKEKIGSVDSRPESGHEQRASGSAFGVVT